MKHRMRICILLLAALLILAVPAMAYEIPTDFTDLTIETAMADFMAANGLNEQNFSVSYTNTVTGETYTFNDQKFMVAGSTYKLPLNMYYYEQELEGIIAPDAYFSRVGTTLDKAHYESLVNSNNEMSIGLLYSLGEFRDYKELMRKYFTMTDEEIDYVYFVDNYYCTRMMMDALCYLYEYRADFEEMIGYMKQAQPGLYFKAGVTEYEVAHKYGWYEGAVNDVGIIYAPQPFLLAVYTQDVGERIVADTAALFTAYNVWQNPPEEEAPEATEMEVQYVPVEEEPEVPEVPEEPPVTELPEEPAAEPETETQPEEVPVEAPKESAFEWWMVAVALGVFLLGGGMVSLLANPSKLKKKYQKKYGDFPDDEDEDDDF